MGNHTNGHVAAALRRRQIQALVRKPEGNVTFVRNAHKQEGKINVNFLLTEFEDVNWIHLAHYEV